MFFIIIPELICICPYFCSHLLLLFFKFPFLTDFIYQHIFLFWLRHASQYSEEKFSVKTKLYFQMIIKLTLEIKPSGQITDIYIVIAFLR